MNKNIEYLKHKLGLSTNLMTKLTRKGKKKFINKWHYHRRNKGIQVSATQKEASK